ncbi:type III pantothenate kinase [Myroides sp. LJL116]
MILAVDIGNTATKVAQFENNSLVEKIQFPTGEFTEKFLSFFSKFDPTTPVVLTSVAQNKNEIVLWLEKNVHLTTITHKSEMPFTNKYATPTTLGIDRMVLAAGATLRYQNTNRLVIDAGTCITYDFIDQDNNYLGGAISPGLQMRYNALNHYTAKLPLLDPMDTSYYIGQDTSQSIHAGIVNAITYEIEGFIAQYEKSYPNLTIILTGGDTLFLAKRLKNVIFANSNFLLESLNALYQSIIENDKKNSRKS